MFIHFVDHFDTIPYHRYYINSEMPSTKKLGGNFEITSTQRTIVGLVSSTCYPEVSSKDTTSCVFGVKYRLQVSSNISPACVRAIFVIVAARGTAGIVWP